MGQIYGRNRFISTAAGCTFAVSNPRFMSQSSPRRIESALISVFHKEGLEPIVAELQRLGVTIYSTGGTQTAIEAMGADVTTVESLTDYPSILGGRVKTLHPKVFGGILGRRELESDEAEMAQYGLPRIDLVIVDLYPFEDTVASGADEAAIIEKIDIGGIALIRAAAKNHRDVVIVADRSDYGALTEVLSGSDGVTDLETRKGFAARAFRTSSHYDTRIHAWMAGSEAAIENLNLSERESRVLRYGENPHQAGRFFGDLGQLFEQIHGKELSYNNLLDVDAAVSLMREFLDDDPTFAILKHNNACGLATRTTLAEAYADALAGDPVSAFGGVLIANRPVDAETAASVHELFCEVVIAPDFTPEALLTLQGKKNRILLKWDLAAEMPTTSVRTALNGFLVQEMDTTTEGPDAMQQVTTVAASAEQLADCAFAMRIAKHTKSNTIVFAKNRQLLASGTGQTSRVDALKQAVVKAGAFGLSLEGAVMASDAFFPFPDCVELADQAGITTVIQPGGSIKDQDSIDYCDAHGLAMYTTGVRHFRH